MFLFLNLYCLYRSKITLNIYFFIQKYSKNIFNPNVKIKSNGCNKLGPIITSQYANVDFETKLKGNDNHRI